MIEWQVSGRIWWGSKDRNRAGYGGVISIGIRQDMVRLYG